MEPISSLQWPVWKNLTDQEKQFAFSKVTMYFVSPLLKISDVKLVNHELFGVKCRTFSLKINDEPFLFVPGNPEAILGWDLGIQGLQPIDLMVKPPESKTQLLPIERQYDFTDLGAVSDYVNEFTSPLRKTAIAPMLVQKTAIPAGTSYVGAFNTITGEFNGNVGIYNQYEQEIHQLLSPSLSPEEAMNWTFPKQIMEEGKFYLEMEPDKEVYSIYLHHGWNYQEMKKIMKKYNFFLMNEDEWEFAAGAGTRRLFRWGNEMSFDDSYVKRMIRTSAKGPNMFGLVFDTSKTRQELTDDPSKLKLDNYGQAYYPIVDVLPLASYYHSQKVLNNQEPLDPTKYLYRKAVRILI